MKPLRIFSLACQELGVLFSLSCHRHKHEPARLQVICCSLPAAQMEIENEPEHGVSQLGIFPTINSVPSGDEMHAGQLQALGFQGVIWDLGLVLSGSQALQLSVGKQAVNMSQE